jgi:hypothetical protein
MAYASDRVFTPMHHCQNTDELYINVHKTIRKRLNVSSSFLQVLVLLFSNLYSFLLLTYTEAGLFTFVKNHVTKHTGKYLSHNIL